MKGAKSAGLGTEVTIGPGTKPSREPGDEVNQKLEKNVELLYKFNVKGGRVLNDS